MRRPASRRIDRPPRPPMPPTSTSTSTSRTRRVQTRVRLARLQRTPALPVSRTRRSCPPLLGDRALSAHLDLRRALSYLPALPCSAASPPPSLSTPLPHPPQGARRARNRMTSRDLAPLPLRRIGRVTDALSLRPVYDGRGGGDGGGLGTEGLPPQHCRDWAGSACSISRLRQGEGRIHGASRRQTDRLCAFSPFGDACIFFSLPRRFSRLPRDISETNRLCR